MKSKIYFFSTLFLLSIAFSAFKPVKTFFADFLGELSKKLQSIQDALPQEKIYLHLDKTFYKPGEDVWFKLYLTDRKSVV